MRSLCAIAFLAGCSDGDPEMFRVDVPIQDQHRSMIVGVEAARELTVRALAISDARTIDPINVPFSLADDLSITALLYDRTLDELELEPGVLVLESEQEKQRSLPSSDRIERLTIAGGAASEWVEESRLPAALEQFKITELDPCGSFTTEVVPLGVTGTPRWVLAVDERWVLVATSTRTVSFVDRDGNVVQQAGMPSSFFDGYREDGGTIWLGGERGVVHRATFTAEPRLSVQPSSTVGSQLDIVSLVGPSSGAPRQQFALTSDRFIDGKWGAFEWFDGQQWRQPGPNRNTPHDATWVAPGYGLFASFFRDATVYGIRDGAEISIEVSSIVLGSIIEIEQMPGFGLVAGSSAGEVHLMPENEAWRMIAGVNIEPINGLHRYLDGIVYLGGDSMIRYVDPGIVCDENVIDRRDLSFARSMTVHGEDVIVPLYDPAAPEDRIGEQYLAWFRAQH